MTALKVKLLPAEKEALEQRSTTNAEAYELFLVARGFQRKGSERLKPVIVRLCRRAVELDPGFAKGWALLSIAESEIAQRGIEGYSVESARAAAERAIAADPSAADGYAALAEAQLRASMAIDEAATDALTTAFRLDPNCYDAHLTAGSLNIFQRNYEKAITHFERAIEIDPDAYWPAGMVSQAYEAIGDTVAAVAAHRRALALCERILADEPDHGAAMGFLVTSLASLGLADRAREWARRALLFDPDNVRLHYNLACAMATLEDADMAVALMDPLIDKVGPGALRWFQSDNSLDQIREHPKFVALSERIARRLAAETSAKET